CPVCCGPMGRAGQRSWQVGRRSFRRTSGILARICERPMDSAGSLNSVAAFSALLSAEDRALLDSSGIVRKFAAGTPIMHEGDPSEHVLIIRHGCVKVIASAPGGTQVVLGIRGPGDIVGELAVLAGRPRRGTVLTIDKVEAVGT